MLRSCRSLTTASIPKAQIMKEGAFYDCPNLQSISLPNTLNTIERFAFTYDSLLKNVVLPNSVTTVGEWAFHNCQSMERFTISNSLAVLDTGVLSRNKNLLSIVITNNITIIRDSVFNKCSGLLDVSMGNNVVSVGEKAFRCSSLEHFYCTNPTPPTAQNNTFEDIPSTAILYVPRNSIALYQAATGWRDFYQVLPIEDAQVGIELPTENSPMVEKIYEDGKIFIIKDGVKYDLNGKVVK